MHNNKLALDALADGGVAPFAGGAKAVKDGAELLVDGHRESTLGTLWALVAELAMLDDPLPILAEYLRDERFAIA